MAGLPGTSCNSVCTLGKRQNLANLRSLISKYCTFCFFKAPLFLIFSKFACMVLVSGSRSSGIYSYTSLTRSFFSTSLTQSSLSEPTTADPFSAPLIMKILLLFKSYKAFRSLLVRLPNLSFGISIFTSFSLKLLMYISIAASLLRSLKLDFGFSFS